jgi:hypothetical protein
MGSNNFSRISRRNSSIKALLQQRFELEKVHGIGLG